MPHLFLPKPCMRRIMFTEFWILADIAIYCMWILPCGIVVHEPQDKFKSLGVCKYVRIRLQKWLSRPEMVIFVTMGGMHQVSQFFLLELVLVARLVTRTSNSVCTKKLAQLEKLTSSSKNDQPLKVAGSIPTAVNFLK